MPSPRADYVCQPCVETGRMDAPVELPIAGRKRCPFCGKARGLQRIWFSQVNSQGKARFVDRLVGPMGDVRDRKNHDRLDFEALTRQAMARDAHEGIASGVRDFRPHALPIAQAGASLGLGMGGSKPIARRESKDALTRGMLSRIMPPDPIPIRAPK